MTKEIPMLDKAIFQGSRISSPSLEEKLRRVTGAHERLALLVDMEAPGALVHREKQSLERAVDAFYEDADIREIASSIGERTAAYYLNYVAGTEIERPSMKENGHVREALSVSGAG
jgi:hypothetical protein